MGIRPIAGGMGTPGRRNGGGGGAGGGIRRFQSHDESDDDDFDDDKSERPRKRRLDDWQHLTGVNRLWKRILARNMHAMRTWGGSLFGIGERDWISELGYRAGACSYKHPGREN